MAVAPSTMIPAPRVAVAGPMVSRYFNGGQAGVYRPENLDIYICGYDNAMNFVGTWTADRTA